MANITKENIQHILTIIKGYEEKSNHGEDLVLTQKIANTLCYSVVVGQLAILTSINTPDDHIYIPYNTEGFMELRDTFEKEASYNKTANLIYLASEMALLFSEDDDTPFNFFQDAHDFVYSRLNNSENIEFITKEDGSTVVKYED